MTEYEYNVSGEQRSKVITRAETQEQTTAEEKALDDKSLDPTGVVLSNSVGKAAPFLNKEIDVDRLLTQTLEGYVLPLLPTESIHIHNIHLKCEIVDGSTSCYQSLQLPSYKQNVGKYQVLDINNIPVSYVFYPNGTIDIYTRNSDRPFRLQTEHDRVKLISFIGNIKDSLPPQVAVPEIDLWEFKECDINRDVRVSDLLHFATIKVQVKHMDHLFRIYIKKIGDKTICRVEETKNLGMPVVEAISHIYNPYDRVERKLFEIKRILDLRRHQ